MNHFDIHPKLTQHCKSIISQSKSKFRKYYDFSLLSPLFFFEAIGICSILCVKAAGSQVSKGLPMTEAGSDLGC